MKNAASAGAHLWLGEDSSRLLLQYSTYPASQAVLENRKHRRWNNGTVEIDHTRSDRTAMICQEPRIANSVAGGS